MRKIFPLFFACIAFYQVNAQSGLYQTGIEKRIHDAFELFDKQQYSASKHEFEYLKEEKLSSEQRVQVDFYHAVSAMRSDNPDGPGLMENITLNYPNDPKSNEAARLLGDFYFEKRQYREAIGKYSKVNLNVSSVEERAEVLFKTGYSYFQLKDYANAGRYFDQVKNTRSTYTPDGLYYAGYTALKQENYSKALADFKEADRYAANKNKVPYMLSEIYYRQQKYDELIQYATPALSERKGLDRKEAIYLLLAEAYFERRDFSNAATYYDAFIDAKKGQMSREQKYKAGVAQFEMGQYQKATNYFKEVALENDKLGQVSSYYLGHSYLKLDNPQFATTSFNTAYKSDFDLEIKQEALYNYAKLNLEKGSFQEAVNALDKYLDQYPQGANVREVEDLLSDALINTNNYLRAIEHMEGMRQKSDRIKAAYQKVTFFQGVTYYRNRNYSGALTYFNKSASFPMDKDILLQSLFWKGETYTAQEKLNDAIRAYEQVIQQRPSANDPTLIKTHYGLGYAYFNTKQYGKAETQFKSYTDKLRGAREKAYYDDALIRLGDSYYVQKKFENALATFRRAANERISFSDYAHYMSGVVLNFQNRNREAITALDQVIEGFPNSKHRDDAIFQKAQINMEESNYTQARDGFSVLIDNRPNSPFVPYALEGRAVSSYSLKDYDRTISDYKRILDNYPNADNADAALVGLQEALSIQGRSGDFSDFLSSYKAANPGNESLQGIEYESAKNLYFSQSYQQAIKAFDNYLKSYPNAGQKQEALYFIGDSYYKMGETDKALGYFYDLEEMGESSQLTKVMQRIASIEYEKGNFQKAIPYFLSGTKNARDRVEEYEAYHGLMLSYYEIEKYDSATFYADKVMGLGDITSDAEASARLLKAKALMKTNKTREAQDELMALLNESESIQGAEALYILARSFHDADDFAKSNETIFDFSERFGVYDYWYGKCFILLARNYVALGENFQAKATLESIVENSDNEDVIQEAKELLKSI